jgi:NAD(P)-dependent dehydrogenase (short-subunit alcohol dehydrogenase family)
LSEAGAGSAKDPEAVFRLDGRVAIVTGASSGMGAVFGRALAAAGARVVLAARREALLEALAEEIAGRGGEALAMACDVAQDDDVDALVAATLARFGRADVLVANAGFTQIIPAEEQAASDWRAQIEVNLTGVFLCAQRFGRVMLDAGSGSIVNVASILGMVGSGQVRQAAYAASKGGVINLTRELAAQWARRGVRVNALAPGWFPTEMTGEMFGDEGSLRWMRSRTPMGRSGELSELVGPLLFLASDASSFVTGHILTVDGGWTCI